SRAGQGPNSGHAGTVSRSRWPTFCARTCPHASGHSDPRYSAAGAWVKAGSITRSAARLSPGQIQGQLHEFLGGRAWIGMGGAGTVVDPPAHDAGVGRARADAAGVRIAGPPR